MYQRLGGLGEGVGNAVTEALPQTCPERRDEVREIKGQGEWKRTNDREWIGSGDKGRRRTGREGGDILESEYRDRWERHWKGEKVEDHYTTRWLLCAPGGPSSKNALMFGCLTNGN